MNPLYCFERNAVKSASVNQREFTVTVVLKNSERSVTIFFKSLAELDEACFEWGMGRGIPREVANY